MATFVADQAFWPPIHALFDFTLTFEDAVMGIAPASLAILLAPWVARRTLRQERCIRTSLLLWVKMAIAAGIFATDIATLVLRRSLADSHTQTSLAATVLTAVASIAISAVIYAHQLHDLQSSAFSSTYLSLTMLLDATKSRSFFTRDGLHPLGVVAAVAAGLKLAMAIAEEIPKTSLLLRPSPHIGRESVSGFWSRLCFAWVHPLLRYGYGHKLTVDDIGGLGPEFAAELLHGQFSQQWGRKGPATSGLGLAMVCFWCFPVAFLAVALPQLCAAGFSFSQPFILQRIIDHLDGGGPTRDGNALIGATVLAFAGYALTNNFGRQMSYRLLTQIRGALVTELFAKCSRLSMREATKISVVTLMTADIQGIAGGLAQLYVIPLSFFQTGLGMYLLSLFVSYSFVLVLVPVAISAVMGYLFGTGIAAGFGRWNGAIEQRVRETSSVLSQLPPIKMHGLGPTVTAFLESQRAEEMRVSRRYRVLQTWRGLVLLVVDNGTPAILFAGALFWTGLGGEVRARQVFPTLAILALVKGPLVVSIQAYSEVMSMLTSLGRIQEFLSTEENHDARAIGSVITGKSNETEAKQPEASCQETQMEKTRDSEAPERQTGPLVEFVNVDVTPAGHDSAILRNVSFTAEKGSLTAVVGAVGSGKSTLLQSVIGEAEVEKGTVSVDKGPVGYCDQHVWLRNASIRDNIIGPGLFDQDRYDKVMRICRLHEDLEQFPEGDRTIVGTNGSNLSGGQKQRLSLARALFLEARLMVLDDIFSGLDHPTAMAIFKDLFGKDGLLRQSECTVILSTHLPECLDEADQILLLGGNGNVSVQNNLKQKEQRKEILEVLQQPVANVADAVLGSEDSETAELLTKSTVVEETIDLDATSKFGLYKMFITSMGLWLFFIYLLLQIAMSVLELLPDIYMRIWVEVAPKNKLYYIGYVGVVVLCAIVGTTCFGFYFIIVAPRSSMNLHQLFSETVMRSTLGFITKTDTGSILNKYSQDMTILARTLPNILNLVLYAGFSILAQIGIILSSSKWMSIAVIAIIAFGYALQYYYLHTSRQIRHLELESHTPLYTQFLELSTGLRHIRAFGWEEKLLAESFKLIDISQKPFYTLYTIQRWLGFALDCMSGVLAIVLAAIAVHMPQSTSQAALGLAFVQIIGIATILEALIDAWTKLETSLGSLLRVHLFSVETPVESRDTTAKLPDVWPQQGKIEFEEVTARYSADDEEKIALRKISFVIEPGQKVGLRGRTGSGKSSVVLTLLRFLEYSGTIRIDGVDVTTIAPDELRRRLITISQHSVKFTGTVRRNLLPFQMNEIDEEKIRERDDELQEELARLNLWNIVQEKGGLDAKLEDVGFSGGQLQMLCIARAILRKREMGGKIVLVDEGTSNIDYETDAAIQKALKEAFADCTMITIAHRTNTIEDCDVQIELSKGEIVSRE